MADDPLAEGPMMLKKSKRPKLEPLDADDDVASHSSVKREAAVEGDDMGTEGSLQEQEEAMVALIEYRSKEVDHLRQRTSYYQSQLEQAEKGLNVLHSKLAGLRSRTNKLRLREAADTATNNKQRPKVAVDTVHNGLAAVKREKRSASPINLDPQGESQLKPQLVIPAVKPRSSPTTPSTEAKPRQSVKPEATSSRAAPPSRTKLSEAVPVQSDKRNTSTISNSDEGISASQNAKKRKPSVAGPKESKEVIPSIRSRSSPSLVHVQLSTHVSSQHNRKLRCLALSPSNDQQFLTSALDGVLNLWQLRVNGSAISLVSSTHCGTSKGRWPEDVVWHPHGDAAFAVYTADSGDSQVSVINLNASREKRVTFFEEKPHVKGIINSIQFMPWTELMFMTGGSDHAVIQWHEKENGKSWKPQTVHRNLHSSAVSGVAGLHHKKTVLSVGADKRIVGYDLVGSRSEFRHQLESKCMSVLPNPLDFNLFMVQTGAPGKQLRLFDIRLRQTELHSFGWKQESSESQSALINPAWSPDGFYISSGSADPMIHIFDIRYTGHTPSQSIPAHQKRVFKAAWHQSLPLLISISSDLNIGLHTMN